MINDNKLLDAPILLFILIFYMIFTRKKNKTKINIKGKTTWIQYPSYHVIIRRSKAQISNMVIPISQGYKNNIYFINKYCSSTRLFFQKRTDVKSFYTKYGLCPLFPFDNPDVILLSRVKRQYFRQVFLFLGSDVIFFNTSLTNDVCRHVSFYRKGSMSKKRSSNTKQIWIMSIIVFFW